ncbi:MAG: glycosyltransferase, partial [Desulfovibrionaceae bacterium]
MDRSLCDIELKMVVKRDDKSPVLDSAEGVVESLSGQALARGAACEVQPTRSWGAPDLDADLAVHVVSGPTLHHPRPWSLNAAVIPADAPAAPANLGDYDLICRMSAGNAAMASFEAPSGGEAPPAAPLAGLFDALADLVGRSPWAGRLAGARERARTISEHGPLVSVLLPTHDRLGFLGAAVDSVLAQSYRNWELLVIQDGGPDVDAVLAQRPDARIRLLKLD